jgi:hypothetical protein
MLTRLTSAVRAAAVRALWADRLVVRLALLLLVIITSTVVLDVSG